MQYVKMNILLVLLMCTEIQSEEKDHLGRATVTENVWCLI